MLPACPDGLLVDELAVVVSAGWGLPSRPDREAHLRHLLMLSDSPPGAPFSEQAQRLLVMLDTALLQDGDDEAVGALDEDTSVGLRILFGTLPRYRTEPSPVIRRREASEYLVPGWRGQKVRDPGGSFQRRHQADALRTALERLRRQYGQDTPGVRDFDLIDMERDYLVAPNRQVTRLHCRELLRARTDGLTRYEFYEPRHFEPGLIEAKLMLDAAQTSHGVTVEEVHNDPQQPAMRDVVAQISEPVRAGDLVSLAWTEELTFTERVNTWRRFWVGCDGPSDSFGLTVGVEFHAAVPLPDLIWWCDLLPDVEPSEVAPREDQLLTFDSRRRVSHNWDARTTERRLSYLMQWVWLSA